MKYKISIAFLLMVAVIGTLLRSVSYLPLPFEYAHLVHAHSHTAFQGWVYLAMHLLLTDAFIPSEKVEKGKYALQFKLTVPIVMGILVSFSLQGYGVFSIVFSTLFQLLNYWFIFRFFKDTKNGSSDEKQPLSLRFVKAGLLFGVLSTLLPYAIGVASAKGFNGTELYQSLVYTFLHLQYNGWFLLVVLGLLFHFFDEVRLHYHPKHGNFLFWLTCSSVLPAISLSLLGMDFAPSILPIAFLSALLTGLALLYFFRCIPFYQLFLKTRKKHWFNLLFYTFLVAFIVKLALQVVSVFPIFEKYAFFNKFIIIAYLHLTLLGAISNFFLALFIQKKWLVLHFWVKLGILFFLVGFAISEILLAATGLGAAYFPLVLAFASGSMALGILLFLLSPSKAQ